MRRHQWRGAWLCSSVVWTDAHVVLLLQAVRPNLEKVGLGVGSLIAQTHTHTLTHAQANSMPGLSVGRRCLTVLVARACQLRLPALLWPGSGQGVPAPGLHARTWAMC